MKMIVFFLASSLVVLIKGQTDCDFDKVCNDLGSPGELTMAGEASALACYTACKAWNDDTNNAANPCNFWTYYENLGFKSFDGELGGVDGKTKVVGTPVCRRLVDCDSDFDISEWCTNGKQSCASGPGSCEACDKCDPLVWTSGKAISHWTCNMDMPYRIANMPPTSVCRTECPSTQWTSDGTTTGKVDAPVEITATCMSDCATIGATKGIWTLAAANTGATVNDNSDPPTPTVDSPCLCEDIVLGANQMPGSTLEKGSRFYCDAALNPDVDGVANTMDSDSRCQLYCNGHLAMDIRCMGGYWSEGVVTNEEIYCWGPPLECDYTTGVNMDVCTCNDDPISPVVTNICAPEQACNVGLCQDVCVQSPTPIDAADGCFCEGKTGGSLCATGSICDDWTCTP